MELKERIIALSSLMSVTGSEEYSAYKLQLLIGDVFDEYYSDKIGNHIFVKRCGRENAPKIMIDCHFDEVGMMVSGIRDGGFVTVANVGGIDPKMLPTQEVVIYGEREVYGVICSTSPHLISREEMGRAPTMEKIMIDTGMDSEELERICPVGTPIGFKPIYKELVGGKLSGKAFDDKACGACAVQALAELSSDELAGDVYFVFTTREEVGGVGATTSSFGIDPDYVLVMDVTFSWIPDDKRAKWSALGSGVAISMSAVTSRRLTLKMRDICEEQGIKHTLRAEPNNTGTDANNISRALMGIPTVLVSLPLRNMHTPVEVISLDDAQALTRVVREFVTSKDISEVFGR